MTIVGHSLGGIVARWYVQEMGAPLASRAPCPSPRLSTASTCFLCSSARTCREASPLLARVRERARLSGVPHTSIVAGDDVVVVGVERACLGFGDVVVADGRGHNAVLYDERVTRAIIDRVRR